MPLILAQNATPAETVPWTPAYLAVAPRALIHAPIAVWSGNNLSSLSGFTVSGTPTKGTAQNSIDPIRFDASTEGLSRSLAISGALYYFWIGARLNTSAADQALFAHIWGSNNGYDGIAAYIAVSNVALNPGYLSADGWRGVVDGGNPPWLAGPTGANLINDTNWHSQAATVNVTANALWKDGVNQTLSGSQVGAVATYGSGTWDFARGAGAAESAQVDWGGLIVLGYVPTTEERQRIEGYYHHLYGIQANLDAGHPYKAAPPTTSPAVSAFVGTTTLTFSASSAPPAGFQMGVNIAIGAFGDRNSAYGVGYVYPTTGELDYWHSKGMDLIRLPFLWERMQPTLGAALNSAEVARVQTVLDNCAARGMTVELEPHNYGRYDVNNIIGSAYVSVANFADFWSRMATEFGGDPALAGFGLMNEPHDMGAYSWAVSAQAAIDAIRAAGSTDIIYVPGDGWSATDVWASTNPDFPLTDSLNKLIYEGHKYFDANHTGTYTAGGYDAEGAYPNVGVDRIQPFIDWLQANGQQGFIGEFNVPGDGDARWLTVLENVVDLLNANGVSGTAWAGGAWWGSYVLTLEPAAGPVDKPQIAVLTKYA